MRVSLSRALVNSIHREREREREINHLIAITHASSLEILNKTNSLSRDDDDDDDDDDALLKCSTKHSRRKTTKSERDDDTNI